MRSIHFSKTEWAFLMCAIIVLCLLAGCGGREANLGGNHQSTPDGIPQLIQRISLVFAGMATVALFFAGIAAWFTPNKLAVAKYAAIAFGVLLSAGLLRWLADHWGLAIGCAGAALVAGIAAYAYLHTKDVKRRLCQVLNTPST